MKLVQGVSTKKVLVYTLLPGILPRLRAFASEGFSWLASLMASLYAAVGLLPPNHPYLDNANAGRFGMRHVMVEAGRRLQFDRKHADQIIIYFLLLTGFVLLLAQIALLVFSFIFPQAMAGPFLGLFVTPNPQNDVAFMLLDRVFAVPDLYGSKFDPALIGMTPFSHGLHELFKFYNQAMLIVGVFILLYYIVILVAETAQSGTPFGKRFDSVWAPIRLVFAIGLLVPLNYGYNSAQYIVLYAAKYGSSFATNGWNIYNDTVLASAAGCTLGGASNAIGECDSNLIATPRTQDVVHLIHFMSLVRACKVAYEHTYRGSDRANPQMEIRPYLVRKTATGQEFELVTGSSTPSPTWRQAVEFYNYGDILIVFGQQSADHTKALGTVQPYCGEVIVPTTDVTQDGAVYIQEVYYALILTMWDDPRFQELGEKAAAKHGIADPGIGPCDVSVSLGDVGDCPGNGRSPGFPNAEFGQTLNFAYYTTVGAIISNGRTAMIQNLDFTVTNKMREYGWGGAGIWYNQIAEWNGALFSAAINIPTPKTMPLIMKEVESQKAGTDQDAPACERYSPYLATKDRSGDIKLDAGGKPIAKMLNDLYQYWRCQNPTERVENKPSGNVIFDVMAAIFGTQGLYTLRENATTHPMAQLAALGRGIVEAAVRNLMTALVFSVGGGMVEIMNEHKAGGFHMASSLLVTLTTIGLSIGFMLYYVMPFLPFMYFFFAVGAWVKAIFEAMVGVPLWALAHLRIHGNGLHGDAALNGYFLIFEIFIRPILTVFGLLAGMVIFSAMVRTLNGIFPMVTANLTGFDVESPKVSGKILGIEFKRAIVDEFFFTLIYTVIVYMIGMASFKLIDMVPNNILRWMGNGAASFAANEGIPDSMGRFVNYAAFSGATLTSQAARAAQKGAQLTGNVLGTPLALMANRTRSQGSQAAGKPGGASGSGGRSGSGDSGGDSGGGAGGGGSGGGRSGGGADD